MKSKGLIERSGLSFVPIWVLIGIGILDFGIFIYGNYLWKTNIQKSTPLLDNIARAKVDISVGHLWFEELMGGDYTITIEFVCDFLYDSIDALDDALKGESNIEGIEGKPVTDIELINNIGQMETLTYKFIDIWKERFKNQDVSGIGSPIDQRFDNVFHSILDYANIIDSLVHFQISNDLKKMRLIQIIILSLWGIVVSGAGGLLSIGIRKRRLAEEELIAAMHKAEAANMAKSTFLANMSHELRTPLNAVIGFSEMLQDVISDKINDKQKKYLDNIYNGGERLLDMINGMLDLSEAEAGRLELKMEEFSLFNLLNNMVIIIKSSAAKKNISVRINVWEEEKPLTITADEGKLKKIVSNLLDNAVKFTPDGGEIKVEAARIGDKVQVSVIDNGIGINPDDKEDIFKTFEQADGSYTRKFGGAGMGLAIAKKFVEMHGGKIWVEMGVGKGSVFKFVIPCEVKGD